MWTGVILFLLALGSGSPATTDMTFAGEIPISEISGAAFLPGDRLLLVADEGNTTFLLEKAAERLKAGKLDKADFRVLPIPGTRAMDDLEDVAWDRQSSVFLVTSHSRNKKGKDKTEKPERFAIVRLPLGKDGADKLPVLDLQVPQELEESMKRKPSESGFNIEGAALSQDGRLLLGLRSPLDSNGHAIVLEVKDPGASPFKAEVKARLDLKGHGIRGMFYDPDEKGFWILAGLSPDPDETPAGARPSLWLWRDNGTLKGTLESRKLPAKAQAFASAETVTRVSLGGQPHLLLVEDAKASGYVLFPVPGK